MRCSRNGSLTTLLELSMTMVARSFTLNSGQGGSFGVLGLPVRANAINEASRVALTCRYGCHGYWEFCVSQMLDDTNA